MANYCWSRLNNTFYPIRMQARYIAAGTWPEDAVEVDDSVFAAFGQGGPPAGKKRGVGEDGMPVWIDCDV